jgi:hypothetical protein
MYDPLALDRIRIERELAARRLARTPRRDPATTAARRVSPARPQRLRPRLAVAFALFHRAPTEVGCVDC